MHTVSSKIEGGFKGALCLLWLVVQACEGLEEEGWQSRWLRNMCPDKYREKRAMQVGLGLQEVRPSRVSKQEPAEF